MHNESVCALKYMACPFWYTKISYIILYTIVYFNWILILLNVVDFNWCILLFNYLKSLLDI